MLETGLLSLRVRPLSMPELVTIRFLSRVGRDHASMFKAAARLRFLQVTLGSSLGWRGMAGLALAEAGLLLVLVDRPAQSAAEIRRKALLVRAYLEADPDGNAGPMLAAGLEADARRLGLLTEVYDGDLDALSRPN